MKPDLKKSHRHHHFRSSRLIVSLDVAGSQGLGPADCDAECGDLAGEGAALRSLFTGEVCCATLLVTTGFGPRDGAGFFDERPVGLEGDSKRSFPVWRVFRCCPFERPPVERGALSEVRTSGAANASSETGGSEPTGIFFRISFSMEARNSRS